MQPDFRASSSKHINQEAVNDYFNKHDKYDKLVLITVKDGDKTVQKLQVENITFFERFAAKFGLAKFLSIRNANLKDVLQFCKDNEIKHKSFEEKIISYDGSAWRKCNIMTKIGDTYNTVFQIQEAPLTENQKKIQVFMSKVEASAKGGPVLTADEMIKGCEALDQDPTWWEEGFPKLANDTFKAFVEVVMAKHEWSSKPFQNICENLKHLDSAHIQAFSELICSFSPPELSSFFARPENPQFVFNCYRLLSSDALQTILDKQEEPSKTAVLKTLTSCACCEVLNARGTSREKEVKEVFIKKSKSFQEPLRTAFFEGLATCKEKYTFLPFLLKISEEHNADPKFIKIVLDQYKDVKEFKEFLDNMFIKECPKTKIEVMRQVFQGSSEGAQDALFNNIRHTDLMVEHLHLVPVSKLKTLYDHELFELAKKVVSGSSADKDKNIQRLLEVFKEKSFSLSRISENIPVTEALFKVANSEDFQVKVISCAIEYSSYFSQGKALAFLIKKAQKETWEKVGISLPDSAPVFAEDVLKEQSIENIMSLFRGIEKNTNISEPNKMALLTSLFEHLCKRDDCDAITLLKVLNNTHVAPKYYPIRENKDVRLYVFEKTRESISEASIKKEVTALAKEFLLKSQYEDDRNKCVKALPDEIAATLAKDEALLVTTRLQLASKVTPATDALNAQIRKDWAQLDKKQQLAYYHLVPILCDTTETVQIPEEVMKQFFERAKDADQILRLPPAVLERHLHILCKRTYTTNLQADLLRDAPDNITKELLRSWWLAIKDKSEIELIQANFPYAKMMRISHLERSLGEPFIRSLATKLADPNLVKQLRNPTSSYHHLLTDAFDLFEKNLDILYVAMHDNPNIHLRDFYEDQNLTTKYPNSIANIKHWEKP